jgi:uncharacterized protein (TIGR02246 family)
MGSDDVRRWVEGYIRAWESNDPVDIGSLFTDDARYFPEPYREPWQGREAIVAGWLDIKDEPGTYSFRHEILAVAGDAGFVRGWTNYTDPPKDYHNLWVIRLTPDGRCTEFTEWWMLEEVTGD